MIVKMEARAVKNIQIVIDQHSSWLVFQLEMMMNSSEQNVSKTDGDAAVA